MTRPLVPDKTQMQRYLRRRLTQQQIADAWEADSGLRASRSAIAMAISRYGLQSNKPRPRYEDTLPWRVSQEHQNNFNAKMLRLESRRRRGDKLDAADASQLDHWKLKLERREAVVAYVCDTPEGFFWVRRRPSDGDNLIRESLHDHADHSMGDHATTRP